MSRSKENGTEGPHVDGPGPKRQCTLSPGHGGAASYPGSQAGGGGGGGGGGHQIRMEDLAHAREMREMRERYERERERHAPFGGGKGGVRLSLQRVGGGFS